jgi:hypothetical protein
MAEFVTLMTDVLAIDLTIGTTTLSLGGIALGTIVLGAGIGFFRKLGGRR